MAAAPETPRYSGRLLIGCPDRPGIVAGVSSFLFEQGANIVSSHQYSSDPSGGRFFLRTEFFLPEPVERERFQTSFAATLASRFGMDWEIRWWGERPRLAIMVSRHDHCLQDLLWRWQRGELLVDIPCVISNHDKLRGAVEAFGIPFHHVPQDTAAQREQAEARMLELIGDSADFLVLARYMRILGPAFVARYPNRIINIHHSFLPAFVGADPYRQAYERGVKIIGATAHYVTTELDQGPIISQDTAHVSHSDEIDDLRRLGRDLERQVLARAVRWHVEDRIIVDGNKTIVFD